MTEFIKKNEALLKKVAEQALDLAKKRGADSAEVDAHIGHGMSVHVLNQQVETIEYDRGKELSVVVYLGKKRGSASTNDFSLNSIRLAVNAAYDFAMYAADDIYSGLPDKKELAFNPPDLELFYPWKDLNAEKAIEYMQVCEQQALSSVVSGIKSDGAGLSSHQSYELLANSQGFMQGYASSSHSMSCALIAEKKGEMQRESEYTCSMDPSELWSTDYIAKEASRKVLSRLGARQIPTQTIPVLFIDQAASAFWKYLISAAMGGNIYRRSSFLLNELNQIILPEFISLKENPFLKKGVGSSPFDDEGVYTREKIFIDQGRLNTYFITSYSGRQLALPTTGNAGGVFNMIVEAKKTHALNDLISGLDKALIVTETLGSGVNIVNGDYSKGIVGFYVQGGKIQFPVEEVTIAGNLKEMYKNIIALGQEQDIRSNIRSGAVLVKSMTVAGS